MKTVHFMGIAGLGMTALAGMFQAKGWKVRGSDGKLYPPSSLELEKMKISVVKGFRAGNLDPPPDLVVVGNVIPRSNPEAQALLASSIPFLSLPHALSEHFLKGKDRVVVAGTHGKTTTSSLLAWIFKVAGCDPSLFVGGIPLNFGRGWRLGQGLPFVVEGDEYDTAFFEKTPKFLHYGACHAVISSIEFDHADIYRDLDHVKQQFEKFASSLPKQGRLVACGDDETVVELCKRHHPSALEFYGLGPSNDWQANNLQATSQGVAFELKRAGEVLARIESPLLGAHNVRNTLACAAMSHALGIQAEAIREGIATFRGVSRRQEFLGEFDGVRLFDDFAHHPTAIAATLAAFEPVARAAGGKLWAVFEPRSNTVRRRIFQKELPKSFGKADEVLLTPVYEKKDALSSNELLDTKAVAASLSKGKKRGRALELSEIVNVLVRETKVNDTVVFMSNGDLGGIPSQVSQGLLSRPLPQ